MLTLTAPGVPDLYQGSELWDLSLVDPDNRRPVDYELRRGLLKQAEHADLAAVWADGDDLGLTKLAVVHRALGLRARRRGAFGPGKRGAYEPVGAEGPAADHVVAFCRGGNVVTVVTRWPLALEADGGWRATSLLLPDGRWREVLCGGQWEGEVPMAKVLARLPVALLEKEKA